jgi:hypothetical protein
MVKVWNGLILDIDFSPRKKEGPDRGLYVLGVQLYIQYNKDPKGQKVQPEQFTR